MCKIKQKKNLIDSHITWWEDVVWVRGELFFPFPYPFQRKMNGSQWIKSNVLRELISDMWEIWGSLIEFKGTEGLRSRFSFTWIHFFFVCVFDPWNIRVPFKCCITCVQHVEWAPQPPVLVSSVERRLWTEPGRGRSVSRFMVNTSVEVPSSALTGSCLPPTAFRSERLRFTPLMIPLFLEWTFGRYSGRKSIFHILLFPMAGTTILAAGRFPLVTWACWKWDIILAQLLTKSLIMKITTHKLMTMTSPS